MKHSSSLLAVLLVSLLLSTSSCTVSASGGELSSIVSKKTLVIGTNAEYAPFEYISSKTAKPVGFDIDFSNLIASKIESEYSISLNVEIKNMEFDALVGSMNSDQIDFIAAAFSITPERQESLLFSDIYYQAKTVLVVKDDNSSITDIPSLGNVKIGAQLGTVQVDKAKDCSTNVTAISALDSLITMLITGNITALMVEDAVGANIIAKNSGLKVIDTLDFENDGGYGIATNLGQTDLISLINEVISTNKASGKLTELYQNAVDQVGNN